jgi:hypothetical protein
MKATLFAVAMSLLLAGCASQSPPPEVTASKSPVASGAQVPKTHHHSTLTDYAHREPVTPDAWAEEDGAADPQAAKTKEECKKNEGASDDCPTQ